MPRVIIVFMFLIVSCATIDPNAPEAEPGPFPDNFKEMVSAHLQETLVEPDSLINFQIVQPPRDVVWRSPKDDELPRGIRAWFGVVSFSAKNRTDGYSGYQLYYVAIRGNKIVFFSDEKPVVVPY